MLPVLNIMYFDAVCDAYLLQLLCDVCHLSWRLSTVSWSLGGVVVRLSDLRLAVVGSNPGHGIAGSF